MGSVCIILLNSLLPTRFHDARNFPTERHAAETDAAHLKLANIAARAATNAAAVARANLELRLLACLRDFCGPCHGLSSPSFTQGNAEALQQLAALLIVFRRRGQRDVHALDLVHTGVINFREDQLILQA